MIDMSNQPKLLLAAIIALVVACGSLPVTRYVIDSWRQGRR